jgi:uncharacterized membrane protein YccC
VSRLPARLPPSSGQPRPARSLRPPASRGSCVRCICADLVCRSNRAAVVAIFVVLITPLSVLLTNVLVPGDWEVAFLRVADVAAGSLLAVAISTILLLWRSTTMMRWVSRPTMGMARFRGHVLSLRAHAVQPSHSAPALMPPSQSAAAMNGSGTTQSGLRLIQ